MKKIFPLLLFLLASCSQGGSINIPDTISDSNNAPSYGYTPIDPLPVELYALDSLGGFSPTLYSLDLITNELKLNSLPDETIRIASGEITGNGSVTFGPATLGVSGGKYIIVLDYVKFNTNSLTVKKNSDSSYELVSRNEKLDNETEINVVPVYIGVGLRLTATVSIFEGSVDLGNLFAVAAAAEAKKASGTLVVQTLGISGPSVSSLIPVPGKIDDTTIQNAIVSLGAIKAKLYEDDTILTPRVVGVYNTLGGGSSTINGFISSLLNEKIPHDIPSVIIPPVSFDSFCIDSNLTSTFPTSLERDD